MGRSMPRITGTVTGFITTWRTEGEAEAVVVRISGPDGVIKFFRSGYQNGTQIALDTVALRYEVAEGAREGSVNR